MDIDREREMLMERLRQLDVYERDMRDKEGRRSRSSRMSFMTESREKDIYKEEDEGTS